MSRKYTPEQRIAKFRSCVDTTGGADACWLWTGAPDGYGYGRMNWDGRNLLAHRLAYLLTFGEIPNGLWVLHHCDNPPCVNPRHLFLGTRQDNIDDMNRKGRNNQPRGDEHPARKNPESRARGSRHGNARLTEGEVLRIRQRYSEGNVSKTQLAREAGIGLSTVGHILAGESWRHIL